MKISTFFTFPGILITIGIALLITSITIIILAVRSDRKEEKRLKEALEIDNGISFEDKELPKVEDQNSEKKEVVVEKPKEDEEIELL